MEKVKASLVNNWRKLFSVFFIMIVFTMPGTKGFLAKFFGVSATGGSNHHVHGNHHGHHNHGSTSRSNSYSTNNGPTTHANASPVQPSPGGCSTGRRHNRSHHRHHRNRHSHYRR